MPRSTPYDREFFRRQRAGAASSAAVVLPLVLEWVRPRSVVDVGCGAGEWLAEAERLGVEDALGVDGSDEDVADRALRRDRVVVRDLERPLDLDRRFDLALCLEVAEHLAPRSAETIVDSLVALAPVVLFSAAAPGQGGTGHVNEEWPEAWARRFAARGYRWADPLRAAIWSDRRVEPWYAQNAIVYLRDDVPRAAWEGGDVPGRPEWPLALVHPRIFEHQLRRSAPTLRNAWRSLRGAFHAAVSRPSRGAV